MLQIKRAYEPYSPDDGERILVDRLWPRGISKAEAHIDEWRKDLGVSRDLLKWYGHDPAKWDEFRKRYEAELERNGKMPDLKRLAEESAHRDITLVFGAKDVEHSNAEVLREIILGMQKHTA